MTDEDAVRLPSDAEVVYSAARLSLATTGVRLYSASIRETESGWTEPWSWKIGVANPAARSVRMRHFHAADSPLEKLAEAAARKWPWLEDDDPPSEPCARAGEETIEIGKTDYYGGGSRGWIDWSDMPFYGPARALWPLEALVGATTSTRAASMEVRGDACPRYVCDVVPAAVERLDRITLVDPPGPDDDWRALLMDVCIDGSGLVRRIAWSPTTGKRFKPGLLPRLAMSLDRSATPDHAFDPPGRLWNVTEFWDYGCDVEISAPTKLIDTSNTSMGDIVRDLWRMRRNYKRTHRRPPNPP